MPSLLQEIAPTASGHVELQSCELSLKLGVPLIWTCLASTSTSLGLLEIGRFSIHQASSKLLLAPHMLRPVFVLE